MEQRSFTPDGGVIRSAELDRAPQTKLGWKASAMERCGVETERGQQLGCGDS